MTRRATNGGVARPSRMALSSQIVSYESAVHVLLASVRLRLWRKISIAGADLSVPCSRHHGWSFLDLLPHSVRRLCVMHRNI